MTIKDVSELAAVIIPIVGGQMAVLYTLHLNAVKKSDERAVQLSALVADNTAITQDTRAKVVKLATDVPDADQASDTHARVVDIERKVTPQ
ncbi:MAG: hypothetical protein NVS1B11_36360 [Terriglobales bacterium]